MSLSILPAALAAVLASGAMQPVADAGSPPLSLAEALLIAENREEPGVEAWQARADALEERGEAESALPDPSIRIGAASIPLTDFDLDREAMTQAQVSVRQMFPRGETRQLRRARREAEAEGARAGMALEAREIRRTVRQRWLELFYWERARDLTLRRREEMDRLAEVATAVFASGRANSHDVIRVDLETAMLGTRLVEIERQSETIRADLARYLGADADRMLTSQMPVLPVIPDDADAVAALAGHPGIQAHNARIEASERQLDLARQAFRPAWAIDAGYGLRGSRSDVASVGVSVEIPLFNRPGREAGVSAARQARSAEELERQASLLDLRRQLDRAVRQYRWLGDTIALHEREVLPRARQTVEAVLTAYENEQADFAELVRAELALLDAELALVRMQVDARQAQADILFLTGDVQ
jgi:outer membrane protein TolC